MVEDCLTRLDAPLDSVDDGLACLDELFRAEPVLTEEEKKLLEDKRGV